MVQTIEEFVNKLQADGVEAGQKDAEKIRAEAEKQAQQRKAEAEEQAQRMIAQAEAESQAIRVRVETDLKLAARDTIVRLQEALNRALQAVLLNAASEKLDDADFLADLIRDVVERYVEADATGSGPIAINVSDDMRQRLLSGSLAALTQGDAAARQIDLRGTLAEFGFTYEIAGGTVEVTADSVVEVLSKMVGSELRKRVVEAAQM
jgi:V/A-type H+/Na+-transporting ATPase subunit E